MLLESFCMNRRHGLTKKLLRWSFYILKASFSEWGEITCGHFRDFFWFVSFVKYKLPYAAHYITSQAHSQGFFFEDCSSSYETLRY